MKKLFTLLTILISVTAIGQATGTVRGIVKDTSSSRQSLQGASVVILDKDSSLLSYGIAKADGSFEIDNVPFGSNLLMISFQGFSPVFKSINLSKEQPTLNVGTIILTDAAKDLGNVTIVAAPVSIKGDTTEFSANAFKTKPNATAEDLLKKLPGVQVEKDGTVKAQGEEVKRVLVDGKRFFGDDPKMATKNLPSDMIDKVQVYDAQSDQSAFSGFDDGNREKTINIITKKDRRKGYFGKGSIGAGDNERYAANISVNRFNGNQQISLVGQANNTNQQNFSMQDILGSMGGGGMQLARLAGGQMGGTQPGITRTLSGGVNYNDAWSKNTSVSGSYSFNNTNVLNGSERLRETFVQNDSSLFTRSTNQSRYENRNHRFNLEFNHKFDSLNSIIIRPSLSYQDSDNFSESSSFTSRGKLKNVNDLLSNTVSSSKGYNFNNSILYRHKFLKKGRTLSVNLTQFFNEAKTDRHNLNYRTNFFTGFNYRDTTDLLSDIDRSGRTLGANISYTEPVDKKSMLELSYNYSNNLNESAQSTDRYNGYSGKYLQDTALTNDFFNTNTSHRVNLNYRRQVSKELSYTAGMGVQQADLTSDNRSKNKLLEQSFRNFFPTLSLQYSKNRMRNFRLNYRGSTRQPNVNQLQDVIDISNPLNIRRGNPGLAQEFQNNFNLIYTSFDILTFRNFVVGANGGFTTDKIVNYLVTNFKGGSSPYMVDSIILGPGAQYSRPTNANGAFNISSFINYGFPIKKIKSNLNFTTTLLFNRDISLVRDVTETVATKAFTRNYLIGERISFTMNLKERFDLNLSSASAFTIAQYSRQPELDGNSFSQVFSIEPTYSSKGGWIFGADFDYTFYKGQSEGYNQSVPLLNAYISKQVFKNKAGEFRLSAFDLLNQNQSISRTIQENYIEDANTQVLQRYFMLSFTYNLRKFGQNAMPGFMNIFRGAPIPGANHVRIVN